MSLPVDLRNVPIAVFNSKLIALHIPSILQFIGVTLLSKKSEHQVSLNSIKMLSENTQIWGPWINVMIFTTLINIRASLKKM